MSRTSLLFVITGCLIGLQAAYMPLKAELAQWLLEKSWQETLRENAQHKPWPWADTYPVARLSLGDVSHIVLQGASGRTLAFGPGHLTGTSEPGSSGHVVISGHRDTHFRALEDLEIDEEVLLEDSAGIKHRYRIESIRIVDTRDERLNWDPSKPTLSLITCYPFDAPDAGTPYRYRVDASLLNG